MFVTEAKAAELRRNLAFPGNIVFTQRGTLGQVVRVPIGARYSRYVISQSQMKLDVDPTIADADFVTFFFLSETGQNLIIRATIATGIPHINLGILKAFPVPLPSLDEQRAIVAMLDALEARVSEEHGSLRALCSVKSALMSVLLTGKVRVKPDENGA